MITLIAARARRGAIGRNGTIPWHAPEDLGAFRLETLGGALIMGRRTWESLPIRPLPGRINCVVSRTPVAAADICCTSVEAALDACFDTGRFRIYGIGGAAIYAAMMPLAHRLMLTEVEAEADGADTFFPTFDEGEWTELRRQQIRAAAPRCVLRELLRR